MKREEVPVDLNRICELVLPVIFSPGPTLYHDIMKKWVNEGLPDAEKNWALEFAEVAVHLFGSLGKCKHRRHQNTFNTDVSRIWFDQSLRILKGVLKNARKDKYPIADLIKQLKKILHVGDLSAHHLLGVAALARVIPTRYAIEASVSQGTQTAVRLTVSGLLKTQVNGFVRFVAKRMGWTEAYAENVLCEWGKGRRSFVVEVVFGDQLFLFQANKSGEPYDVTLFRRIDNTNASRTKRKKQLERKMAGLKLDVDSPFNDQYGYHWSNQSGSPQNPDEMVLVVDEAQRRKNQIAKEKRNLKQLLRLKGASRRFANSTNFGVDLELRDCVHRSKEECLTLAGSAAMLGYLQGNQCNGTSTEEELETLRRDRREYCFWEDEMKIFEWGGKDGEYGDRKASAVLRQLHSSSTLKAQPVRLANNHKIDQSHACIGNLYAKRIESVPLDPKVLLAYAAGHSACKLHERFKFEIERAHLPNRNSKFPPQFAAKLRFQGCTYTIPADWSNKGGWDLTRRTLHNWKEQGLECCFFFESQADAVRALCWYLLTSPTTGTSFPFDAQRWIAMAFHTDDWRAPVGTGDFEQADHSHGCKYVIINQDCDTKSVALLQWHNEMIQISFLQRPFFRGSTKNLFVPLAQSPYSPEYSTLLRFRDKPRERRNIDTSKNMDDKPQGSSQKKTSSFVASVMDQPPMSDCEFEKDVTGKKLTEESKKVLEEDKKLGEDLLEYFEYDIDQDRRFFPKGWVRKTILYFNHRHEIHYHPPGSAEVCKGPAGVKRYLRDNVLPHMNALHPK